MRKLASFTDPAAARALDDLLSSEDIPTLMRDADAGGRAVWVVSEQDLPKAEQLLAAFLNRRTPTAVQPKPAVQPAQRAPAASVGLRHRLWAHFAQSPVTWSLLAVAVVVSFYTDLGENRARVAMFTISGAPPLASAVGGSDWTAWDDVRAGQLWRLVTPILLHFHPFHLLFNAFWLRDLGVPTERFQGSRQYAVFLLWSALLSNVAQLAFGLSPNFGGLSGVVYALMGFLWARGRFDRRSGITLPTNWVVFFVGWMALGFTGLMDGVFGGSFANYCHLGGFAAGVIYGYIGAMLAKQVERR
jgi:GlpG protein